MSEGESVHQESTETGQSEGDTPEVAPEEPIEEEDERPRQQLRVIDSAREHQFARTLDCRGAELFSCHKKRSQRSIRKEKH